MFRTPPRRALRMAGVLAVTAGLFATGCGQVSKAGAAALVGDQRIAIEELSQSVEATERAAAANQLRVSDRSALVRGVLSRQIISAVLEEAADRRGITVTRGDVDRQIDQRGGRKRLEAQALRSAVPPQELRDYVRNQIIQQRLAETLAGGDANAQRDALVQYLHKVARDMGVTVSPRYGRFNVQRLSVTAAGSDLSTPDPDQPAGGAGLRGPGPAGSGG